MARLLYRRGRWAEALPYLDAAMARLTLRNPNPYDGEASYLRGLCLVKMGRLNEARDAFYKATWNEAWQASAWFELARLACREGDHDSALSLLHQVLERNVRHHKARHLKAAVLRRLGRDEEEDGLALDGFNHGLRWEQALRRGGRAEIPENTAIDWALDYAHAGFWVEALDLLTLAPETDPMRFYYAGWIETQRGDHEAARRMIGAGSECPRAFCFPNRPEAVCALETAMRLHPEDATAPYALGNFWYAHRRYEEAVACWEAARDNDPGFATAWRNLGLAAMNKAGDSEQALACYEKAFELEPGDARVFFELDQLRKKRNEPVEDRRSRLEQHLHLVRERDDLMVEFITLENLVGRHREALDLLMAHRFHPWEGGEGKVAGQYVFSLTALAREALAASRWEDAAALLERARAYPDNLGEGKLPTAQENDLHYYLGCAHEGLGQGGPAQTCFEKAAQGSGRPNPAMYYNDQPPDMMFYQGLALEKLGREEQAKEIFECLAEYGASHLDDDVRMDYFAVSLPDFLVFDEDLNHKHRVHCHYMRGLGLLGLGEREQARESFDAVLREDASHAGVRLHGSFDRC
jgi:tetratricopeptide (TPR) repeat protein